KHRKYNPDFERIITEYCPTTLRLLPPWVLQQTMNRYGADVYYFPLLFWGFSTEHSVRGNPSAMAPPLNDTLIEGRVSHQLRVMAASMVWGLMVSMLLNLVDTFFIVQLGRTPLAALSFTFLVIMVLTSLAIGLGAGTSSAVARAICEGDSSKARRLAT